MNACQIRYYVNFPKKLSLFPSKYIASSTFPKAAMLLTFSFFCWYSVVCQQTADDKYIGAFKLPYVARLSLEKAGAGLQISPDNTLVPPTASFPFNTGLNLGLNLSYKFINLSVSQSVNRKTNNSSFVVAAATENGANTFGGKFGFYKNVAALQDKKNFRLRSSISLFKFSPYWLINVNHRRLSLRAINDYSQRQLQSAGGLLFDINPNFIRAGGKPGDIIPYDATYRSIFEDMAGLHTISIVNLDIRPGYMYTKVFREGLYFISGALFLGPGFGYHYARSATTTEKGMHWQSSLRMNGSAGYNGDKYFVAASFRYTNSFTPVSQIGVLVDEGLYFITFGIHFGALEKKIPNNLQDIINR